jgi:hypothetical protein
LNDALSFEIKKYGGQNFREYNYSRWTHGPSLNDFASHHSNGCKDIFSQKFYYTKLTLRICI